ncbi:MAG: transposase [Gammaproteobacteria bacterium]
MPNYRRAIVPGGTFFFTVVSWQRRPVLCHPDIRAALRAAIMSVRGTHPITINAWVLLPDHLHCVWTLPDGDADFSVRWAMIKRFVTRRITGSGNGAWNAPYGKAVDAWNAPCGKADDAWNARYRESSRLKRHEGGLWQRRFWEHRVRDQADLNRCQDYLHWNPVKHRHVSRVADWPFSTFHRFACKGYYPRDWGGQGVDDAGVFGE